MKNKLNKIKKLIKESRKEFRKLYRKKERLEEKLGDIENKMCNIKNDLGKNIDKIVGEDFYSDLGYNFSDSDFYVGNMNAGQGKTIYSEIKERIKYHLIGVEVDTATKYNYF